VEGLKDASQAGNNKNLSSGAILRRSQRVLKKKIFSNTVVFIVSVKGISGPVQPIKYISLAEAIQKDASGWLKAINSELKSL
jgi:hypothetical protein